VASTFPSQANRRRAVEDEKTTQPEGSDETEDTEGHKFNIGLGPVTPDEDTEDTEGHKFNIGLGPVTPDDTESDKKEGDGVA
jgi:hypothetical protein